MLLQEPRGNRRAMQNNYDVYLTGTSADSELQRLVTNLEQCFGPIPETFIHCIGHRPVRVRECVARTAAEGFAARLRRMGATVEVHARSSAAAAVNRGPSGGSHRDELAADAPPGPRAAEGKAAPGPVRRAISGSYEALKSVAAQTSRRIRARLAPNVIEQNAPRLAQWAANRLPAPWIVPAPPDANHPLRRQSHQVVVRSEATRQNLPARSLQIVGASVAGTSGRLRFGDSNAVGVILERRRLTWAQSAVSLAEIRNLAIQADANGRPYIELTASSRVSSLPQLPAVTTLLLAIQIASNCPEHRLWISPRACRWLRRPIALEVQRLSEMSLLSDDAGAAARAALPWVRASDCLLQGRIRHWERWRRTAPSANTAHPSLGVVSALEFIELKPQIRRHTRTLVDELLEQCTPLLGGDEGVLALFQLHSERFMLPHDIGQTAARALITTVGERLASSSTTGRDQYLSGSLAMLTQRRLLFVRPSGAPALEIPLNQLQRVSVDGENPPRLQLQYEDSVGQIARLDYPCSANLLYPLPLEPQDLVRALGLGIVQAQQRLWERRQPAVIALPELPATVAQATTAPCSRPPDRAIRALQTLLDSDDTPQRIRQLCRIDQQLQFKHVQPLRSRLVRERCDVSLLGERLLLIPGAAFAGPEDSGALLGTRGVGIVGVEAGVCPYGVIDRFEVVDHARVIAALVGRNDGAPELVIKARRRDAIQFLGLALATARRALTD